ncbi:transposon Ty3-I Gag-Pol polyprotein [Trichonephila clavipes]|nr:transposon Ty3-I Gag-Pol polyprotein [Trichonephila clavipes]
MKWFEVISVRKASTKIIGNTLFENYISQYEAPVKMISDNGPQIVSEVFEHLSNRIGIEHVKTKSKRTERVNRDLLQMIASFVKDHHENWDQFLRDFVYALRTSVHEITGKTRVELFWGKKLVTPFRNL